MSNKPSDDRKNGEDKSFSSDKTSNYPVKNNTSSPEINYTNSLVKIRSEPPTNVILNVKFHSSLS